MLSLGTYKPILASTGCFHPDVPQRQVCPGSRGTSTGCAHPVRAHVLCLHRHAPVSPRLREGEKDQGDNVDDGDVQRSLLVSPDPQVVMMDDTGMPLYIMQCHVIHLTQSGHARPFQLGQFLLALFTPLVLYLETCPVCYSLCSPKTTLFIA